MAPMSVQRSSLHSVDEADEFDFSCSAESSWSCCQPGG